ncbi:hypothetical protein ABW19_dt0206837 [Dactylella cylindrospora]|nr:hypothetical protein ABW19_dt0206837 [Dactylella cylindrospora]
MQNLKDHLQLPEEIRIEKIRNAVRKDIFDENHVLQQYPYVPIRRSRLTLADLKIEMVMSETRSERRPSIDLVQAAQAARRDIWRLHEGPNVRVDRSPSRERPKSAVDLIEAANRSRKKRGEEPLPEPAQTGAEDPEEVPQRKRLESPIRYEHSSETSSRVNTAGEGAVRNISVKSQNPRRRSHSLDHGRYYAEEDRPRPSTSGKPTRYPSNHRRTTTPPPPCPPLDREASQLSGDNESIAELASKFPPTPKSPRSLSRRSSSRRSSRRSADSSSFHGASRVTSPMNDIQILEVMKSDGELHERYTSNTEDVEYVGAQFSRAVIHEKVVPKVHNIVTTEISRHHHTHEIRQHVQPVVDIQYEPEKHWIQTADGKFVEVSAEEVESLKGKYKYTTRVEEPVSSAKIPGKPYGQSWKPRRESLPGTAV